MSKVLKKQVKKSKLQFCTKCELDSYICECAEPTFLLTEEELLLDEEFDTLTELELNDIVKQVKPGGFKFEF